MTKPICVVGTRSDQQQIISKRFPSAKFKFVGSDQIDRGGSSLMRGQVIIWTNFVSHKHTSRAKAMASDIRFVSGGMTSLIAAIDQAIQH